MIKEDAGNEEQVKKRMTKKEHARAHELLELKDALDHYDGRAFFWRMLGECGIFDQAPYQGMERFEGKRDIGLWLTAEINAVPGEWFPMMQSEAIKRNEEKK